MVYCNHRREIKKKAKEAKANRLNKSKGEGSNEEVKAL